MNSDQIRRMVHAFLADQDGVTAIEYALLAALIFGLIVVSVGFLGDNLKLLYDDVATQVAGTTP